MTPVVVIRPILLPLFSVNQRLPSGPAVIPSGLLEAVGVENSLIVTAFTDKGATITSPKIKVDKIVRNRRKSIKVILGNIEIPPLYFLQTLSLTVPAHAIDSLTMNLKNVQFVKILTPL
jgi:hypothetical protein